MSHNTPHPSDETLLLAIDGELSPRLGARLDLHLASCEGCRDRLQAMRSSADRASAECLRDTMPVAPALGEMRTRLRAGLADRSAALDRSWRFQVSRRLAHVLPAAAAAAAIVAIVGGGALVRHTIDGWRSAATVEAGALPIPALTPGATERVTAVDLCAGKVPSREEIAPAVRQAVLRDYGMEGLSAADYELDYLITPELGGSSDRRNLWPERYGSRVWNARVKDELEQLLPPLVCRGAVELTTAQRDIALDWIAAYKKYFHTDRPVITQARAFHEE
jgi:anti-sigma factor RsiW